MSSEVDLHGDDFGDRCYTFVLDVNKITAPLRMLQMSAQPPFGTVVVRASWSDAVTHREVVWRCEARVEQIMSYPRAYPARPHSTLTPWTRVLRLVGLLLPAADREEWLEEQRGYLADLPARAARWQWVAQTVLGMPRYAYTVRTGRRKETA